ncbi:MAG: TonB-dependent receptor [Calditrichia bacterium]
MTYLNRITFFVVFLGILGAVWATETVLRGKIVNENQEPVPDAYIIIHPEGKETVSGHDGRFMLRIAKGTTLSLEVHHIAYETGHLTLQNLPSKDEPLKIVLKSRDYRLPENVVTATRVKESVLNIPMTVTQVDRNEIRLREVKTSAEALRESPGVFVQKTNHGGGSAIIRGFSSNQILLMVDGVRLNNSTYRLGNHQYLTTVDAFAVDKIEVVEGPTSVLYGSDALGGTIQLLTPLFRPGETNGMNWGITARSATADKEKTASANFSRIGGKWAFWGVGSYKSFGDLRRGTTASRPELEKSPNGTLQAPSGFEQWDGSAKVVYQPDEHRQIISSIQYTRQKNVPRYDKYENDGYYLWEYEPQERLLCYTTYRQELQNSLFSDWQISFSLHRQLEGRRSQKQLTTSLKVEEDEVWTPGLSLQSHLARGKHLITGGAEVYSDFVESKRKFRAPGQSEWEYDLRGRYPDEARYTSLGIFVQDEWHYLRNLHFIGGLRYSRFQTAFNLNGAGILPDLQNIEQSFQALTGHLGAVVKISGGFSWTINVAQGFRAPNLSDLAKLGESKGDTYEVPNASLEPEKLISLESGVKLERGAWRGHFSLYQAYVRDLIDSAPALFNGSDSISVGGQIFRVKSKQNIGKAGIRGAELALRYYLSKGHSLYGSASWTYGENTTLGEPVGGIPPVFGKMGWRIEKARWQAELFSRWALKQDRLSADDLDDPRIPKGGTPGWITVNFRNRLSVHQKVDLQISLENIFDRNYREHRSGINAPGRNLIVSLHIKG